jgi:hypothetical protein
VFQQQKWTPQLMAMTLQNAIGGINETVDEATYRLSATVHFADGKNLLSLNTMQSAGDAPLPVSALLANWWGDKFNRLYGNAVKIPDLKDATVTVDLLPERRVATIENAWTPNDNVRPGDEIPIKVFLRPYRGERLERDFTLKLPPGISKGDHRILLSDADVANRTQIQATSTNHYMYVSLVASNPTAYYEDKTLPSLPSSILNVMQAGRTTTQTMITSPESASEQMSLPFDYVVNGSYTLRVTVK